MTYVGSGARLGISRNGQKHAEIVDENVTEEGLQALLFLNEWYCQARHQGRIMVMERTFNHLGEREVHALTKRDIYDRHEADMIQVRHVTSNGETWKTTPIAKYWFKWPHKNTKLGTMFTPLPLSAEQGELFFNLYPGFSREPIKGDCRLIKAHLRQVWCGGNDCHYKYLITWFAHMLQRPWEKPGVALVVKGGKGTGKSTVFEAIFQKILGRLYTKIAHRENLSGRFNYHHLEKLLLVIEEAFFHADHQAEAVIKSMITERMMLVEPKGVDPYEAETFYRLAFVSNDDHVVPASLDERRFFCLRVSSAKVGNREYFHALNAEIQNGGLEAFMDFLMHWEVDIDLLRTPPMTETMFEEIMGSFSVFEKWAYHLLHIDEDHSVVKWGQSVPTADLFEHFKQWRDELEDLKIRTSANRIDGQIAFTNEIGGLFGFPRKKVKNRWCFILPTREQARRLFQAKVNATVKWYDLEEDEEAFFGEEAGKESSCETKEDPLEGFWDDERD